MPKWRADYFDNREDSEPSHSELIEAKDANEAASKAAERKGDWMRVDLTLTVLKNSS